MLRHLRPLLALSAMVILGWSTGNASAASAMFGGWELNRPASKLTMAPKDAETVVIVPWGNSGWIWNEIAGSPYQPEDLQKGVNRVECGASHGATAIDCKGPPVTMMLYWASWDSKPFPTYGAVHRQVQVKRVNDQTFEATFFTAPQTAAQGNKSTVAFSEDGKHLTVTTKDDVRVYDFIDAANWPTVKP